MRLILAALALGLSGMAHAQDCQTPRKIGQLYEGVIDFAKCTNARITALERQNAELRDAVAKLQAALSEVPGELKNDAGRITRSGGEALTLATFTAKVRRREGSARLEIDQAAVEKLCQVGCALNLILVPEGLRAGDQVSASAAATCTFVYAAESGAWSQTGGCGDPTSGVDGDGKPAGDPGGDIIATVGGACILADSEPSRSVGAADAEMLNADRTKGLFLIAAPALWTGTEDRFRCELKIGR
jgi:hypothetical protein